MGLIVVVDDERTFKSDEEIIYLRSSVKTLGWLADCWANPYNELIEQLWLDHDLGGQQSATGQLMIDNVMPVVRFLEYLGVIGWPLNVSNIFVHTQNPSAGDNIVRSLSKYYTCARVGLPELLL